MCVQKQQYPAALVLGRPRWSGPIVLPRPQETGAEAAKPDGDAEPPNSVAGHAMWTPAALFFLSFLFFLDCAFSLLPPYPLPPMRCDYLAARDSYMFAGRRNAARVVWTAVMVITEKKEFRY